MTTLQVPGPWRADDLAVLPDDGHRYEIVDGLLLVNAAPTPRHQRLRGEEYQEVADAGDQTWTSTGARHCHDPPG